jgi:hypothetical protein
MPGSAKRLVAFLTSFPGPRDISPGVIKDRDSNEGFAPSALQVGDPKCLRSVGTLDHLSPNAKMPFVSCSLPTTKYQGAISILFDYPASTIAFEESD